MEKPVLVFGVAPYMGHLAQSVQSAKLMLEKNNQVSVLFLVMKMPLDPEGTSKVQNIISGCNVERLRFHHLPTPENTDNWSSNRGLFINRLVEYQKPHVREVASKIKGLSGLILDVPTSILTDVAEEFQVPSYIFFTSSAASFGLMLHLQSLQDEHNQDTFELLKTSQELIVPSLVQPVPISVLPTFATDKLLWSSRMHKLIQYWRKPKGLIINTFAELEDYALDSFVKDSAYGKSGLPRIYPIGPVLNRSETKIKSHSAIIEWLDNQPPNSVVLVCFGSLGSLDLDQVKEIASGLEQSAHRFLWVLRRPSTEKGGFPSEYENLELVLPKGFLLGFNQIRYKSIPK